MKYSVTSSSDIHSNALFCEQVQQLTNFYEQWNDCERTVVISALFKRLPFANLKFLLHSIDHYLKQSLTTPQQLVLLEEAANATSFLNKLVQKYNSLANLKSSNDNIDANGDLEFNTIGNETMKSLENDLVSKYTSKEEVVQDLLMYLPLLRPTNDEAKKIYLQLLPMLVDDSIKHSLPVELVQQILSYLLIHPALKSEDRKPLHQLSHKLQEHIAVTLSASTNVPANGNLTNCLPNEYASSFMSNASSMSSASSSSSTSTTWPTAVPQIQMTSNEMFNSKRDQEFWDLRNFQVTAQDTCDDLNQKAKQQTKYNLLPIGNNSASQNSLNNSKTNNSSIFDTGDEHHISFSKNGTDVEFDSDYMDSTSKSTTSLTINAPVNNSNDFLTVPKFFNDRMYDVYGYGGGALSDGYSDDGNMIKTRRSNSLTTPTASGEFMMSSSAENLANLQKPRSFSLTMDSSRKTLMSSGSETRLDKLAQMSFNNTLTQLGMGNIAVWLKSLRLHKYFWLFNNMSYEQMMEMTEEYLENLGVTKGARHKLVLCIQKLSERVTQLKQFEKELMEGRPLKSVLDEVTNIILTPMKPINSVPCDEDVATHVMKVLDCAFLIMQGMKYFSSADEDSVNVFVWILDKALHHDAFLQQTGRLKEYKYKLYRIKMVFGGPKTYNNGNNSVNNLNKNNMKRSWNKGKVMNTNSADHQKHRKNSMPYYNLQPYQMSPNNGINNNNNKSLSFPNFGSTQASNITNFQRSASREKLNQFTLMQQQHHTQYNQQANPQNGATRSSPMYQHRNSLNSLMPFPVQQQQYGDRRNSSCGTDRMSLKGSLHSPLGMNNAGSNEKILSESGLNSTSPNMISITNTSLAPTTSDINSRLESLCRQMTETAIN